MGASPESRRSPNRDGLASLGEGSVSEGIPEHHPIDSGREGGAFVTNSSGERKPEQSSRVSAGHGHQVVFGEPELPEALQELEKAGGRPRKRRSAPAVVRRKGASLRSYRFDDLSICWGDFPGWPKTSSQVNAVNSTMAPRSASSAHCEGETRVPERDSPAWVTKSFPPGRRPSRPHVRRWRCDRSPGWRPSASPDRKYLPRRVAVWRRRRRPRWGPAHNRRALISNIQIDGAVRRREPHTILAPATGPPRPPRR